MKTVERAGGVVINPDQGILVVTNQLGKATLPKGRIKPGETDTMAAIREIKEESGVRNLNIVRGLGTLVRPGFEELTSTNPDVIKCIFMLLCTTHQVEVQPLADDIVGTEWVDPEEIDRVLSWPEEAAFIAARRPELTTIGLKS